MSGLAFEFVLGARVDAQFVGRFVAIRAREAQCSDAHLMPEQISHVPRSFQFARAVGGYVHNFSRKPASYVGELIIEGNPPELSDGGAAARPPPKRSEGGGNLRPSRTNKGIVGAWHA